MQTGWELTWRIALEGGCVLGGGGLGGGVRETNAA